MDSFEAAFTLEPPPRKGHKKKKQNNVVNKEWASLDQQVDEDEMSDPLDFMHGQSDPNEKPRKNSVNDFFSSLSQSQPGEYHPDDHQHQQEPFELNQIPEHVAHVTSPSSKKLNSDSSSSELGDSLSMDANKIDQNRSSDEVQTWMKLKLEKTEAKIKEYEYKLNILRQQKKYYYVQLQMNSPQNNKNFIKPNIHNNNESNSPKSRRSPKKPSFTRNKARKTIKYELVDAIQFMKKGSSMLKYGRFGYPHFRHFELTKDCGAMIWYSESKKLNKSRIELNNVTMLQKGQKTPLFKKHMQPKLESCSFSLIYGPNGTKTLDVITKNKQAYVLWTTGLSKLIDYHNAIKRKVYEHNMDNEKACIKPQSVMVRIKKRNLEAMENRLSMQPSPPRKVVEKDLDVTIKTFARLMTICNEPRYNGMQGMDDVKKRLVELEVEIENIRHSFQTKSLNVASHEIWRTSVEIKALDSKVHAIIKSRSNNKLYN